MPGQLTSNNAKHRFLLWERERRRCVDTNCHSKSITVPVTVVLGLAAFLQISLGMLQNPRQMNFFSKKKANLRPWYMHFGKSGLERCGSQ